MYARWGLFALSISMIGCSATKFSSKQYTLSSKSVFGTGQFGGSINQPNAPTGSDGRSVYQPPVLPTGANGSVLTSPGTTSGANGSVVTNDPGKTGASLSQVDGTDDEIDLRLLCSDARSATATNFKKALSNNLKVDLLINSQLCTSDITKIKSLIEKKSFTIADASSICPAAVPTDGKLNTVSVVIDGKAYDAFRGVITLLYALNTQTTPANQAADSLCDQRASPLVIHVASDENNPIPIALSSQEEGINFDLLGSLNGYSPVRISWFTNQDYRLLALPDSRGNVRGIDQLFGNATLGPDGRTADNGYAALAKYDINRDHRIDAKDPVYYRLRLFLDKNRDGISQSGELISLQQAKIAYIDLDYSNDFSEEDQYGNQTMMKSVVGYFDGSLDLIFDLWFAYR